MTTSSGRRLRRLGVDAARAPHCLGVVERHTGCAGSRDRRCAAERAKGVAAMTTRVMYDGDHTYDLEAAEISARRFRTALVEHRRSSEVALGARLVCKAEGMPVVTERHLR